VPGAVFVCSSGCPGLLDLERGGGVGLDVGQLAKAVEAPVGLEELVVSGAKFGSGMSAAQAMHVGDGDDAGTDPSGFCGTILTMPRPHIAVFIAQSVDGYIATDDDSLDWLTAAGADGEDYGFDAFLSEVDVVAMGRSTYEFIKDFPELPYGSRPVHVFTTRGPGPRKGFEFYARTPVEAVTHWEEQGVGRVYLDGGTLISQFLDAGLVDEMTITTVPLLLGSGKPLFHRIAKATRLRLVNSQVFESGLVSLRYERA
jgi:dihydrofolate reductase